MNIDNSKSKSKADFSDEECDDLEEDFAADEDDQSSDQSGAASFEAEEPTSAKVQHKDWKTLVITSQQFDGCWDDKALTTVLGASVYAQVVAQKPCSEIKVWTSALAMAILELKCMSEKTSWEVVANKGRAFMSKMLLVTEKKDKEEILQMVLKFITQAKEILVKFI
jgi:hypothetical protein